MKGMSMVRLGFLLALIFHTSSQLSASDYPESPVTLNEDFTSENITSSVFIYQAKKPTKIQDLRDADFTKVSSPLLNFQFSDDEFWLRFSLKNESQKSKEVIIQARNWFLDVADLYTLNENGTFITQSAGDWVPMSRKEIRSKYPSFSIDFAPMEAKTFYLKLKNTNYNQLDVFIMDSKMFFRSLETGSSWELVVGLILMRITFHIALLIVVFRDRRIRSFNLFGIYLCAVFYFASGYGGFSFPESPYWTNKAFYFILSLAPAVICYYLYAIYRLDIHLPKIRWIYIPVALVGVVNILYNLFFQSAYVSWLYICFMFGFVFLSFLSLFFFYRKYEKPSFWYLFNVGLYLPAFTYMYSRNAGLIQSPYDFNVIQFVFVIDFLTIGFILAGMFKLSQKEIVELTTEVVVKQEQALALRELNKAKSSIFTNITHELRTPLTLILSPLEQLTSKLPHHQELNLISKNAHRLLEIVNQMLEVAKLDAGMMVRQDRYGEIGSYFQHLVDRYKTMADEKSIDLVLEKTFSRYPSYFDQDIFEKIFGNLISNAIKFTPKNGSVFVYLGITSPQMLTVEVRDTGIGIHDKDQDKIFDRFFQGSNSEDNTKPGTGIGLSIVKDMVHFLEGRIELSSTPNEGTSFTVQIPIAEMISESSEKHENLVFESETVGIIPSQEAEFRRLLIVEDNDDLRNHLVDLLGEKFEITTAINGLDGLEKAKNWMPDFIISDIMMPIMDGIQLCRQLQEDFATSHIPVIFLTAKVEDSDRLLGLEVGAVAYVTKPFLRSELLFTLQNIDRVKRQIITNIGGSLLSVKELSSDMLEAVIPENVSTQPISPKDQDFMKKIISYIDQNYVEPDLDLEKLCTLVGLGKTTLIHKFKAHRGITPIQYIKQYRLEKAKELLEAKPLMQISDVAYSVGFNSPRYFSTAFGEYFGYPPSKKE